MFRKLGITSICVATLLVATMAIAENPLDDKLMYGIDRNDGTLVRHKFDDGSTEEVGTIVDADGNAYTGIEAAAFKPKGRHILGFWMDPSVEETKVLFINPVTAKGTIVGNSLGEGRVTGACTAATGAYTDAEGNQVATYDVFAIQEAKFGVVDFDITNGEVIPTETYAARITILGAAIETSSYDVPVTVQLRIGNDSFEPFGPNDSPTTGNVNDVNFYSSGNNVYTAAQTYPANTPIVVEATSWLRYSGYDGDQDSEWYKYLYARSNQHTQQVMVLRNGDSVPDIEGYRDQDAAQAFVKDYIDEASQTIKLDNNQAIYLFELGTTNISSSAADFQDLVVLVTLATDIEQLDGISMTSGQSVFGKINVNPNNSPENEFTMDVSATTQYTRDDLHKRSSTDDNGTFYEGPIQKLTLKPKGNWAQNSLVINGQVIEVKNTDTIVLEGNLTVRVYNDHINRRGRAMGHWWIEIGGSVAVEGDPDHTPSSWLVKVDTATGSTEHVMDLHKIYDSLSAISSTQFYATFNDLLYLIDTETETQTVIGSMDYADNTASEFIGTELFDFSSQANSLFKTDTSSGATSSNLVNFGSLEFGSLVSVDLQAEPQAYVSYD